MFLPCEYEYTQGLLKKLSPNVTKGLNLFLRRPLRLAPEVLEKVLEDGLALPLQGPPVDAGPVVEPLLKEVEH